jgi:hypothetical protein
MIEWVLINDPAMNLKHSPFPILNLRVAASPKPTSPSKLLASRLDSRVP